MPDGHDPQLEPHPVPDPVVELLHADARDRQDDLDQERELLGGEDGDPCYGEDPTRLDPP